MYNGKNASPHGGRKRRNPKSQQSPNLPLPLQAPPTHTTPPTCTVSLMQHTCSTARAMNACIASLHCNACVSLADGASSCPPPPPSPSPPSFSLARHPPPKFFPAPPPCAASSPGLLPMELRARTVGFYKCYQSSGALQSNRADSTPAERATMCVRRWARRDPRLRTPRSHPAAAASVPASRCAGRSARAAVRRRPQTRARGLRGGMQVRAH